jgi:hypothetical protein
VTPTITPTVTPSSAGFLAYIFAEPQEFADGVTLEDYMTVDNVATWGGYQFYGTPGSVNYSNNLDIYAHFSGWTSNTGNYITPPASLNSSIRQASGAGTDAYGCTQSQYTFGTIAITTTQINPNIQYFYSIWLPLAGVGGTFTNETVDAGYGAPCSTSIGGPLTPDLGDAAINVTVTSGAAIPAGTYRVLWLGSFMTQPQTTPATLTLYIKGNTKT